MIALLLVGFSILVVAYSITTRFICGTPDDVCISAYTFNNDNIFVFRWHGLYYAESWCKYDGITYFARKRTRFTLTKDKALELAQLDIRAAHAMVFWDE